MTSPIYYRREAERCRRLAHASKGTEAERRWLALANDYDLIATELDRHPDVAHRPGSSYNGSDRYRTVECSPLSGAHS
jgi:hypothetical protein